MTVAELVAWIELKEKGFEAGLARKRAQLSAFKQDLDSSSSRVDSFGKALSSLPAATPMVEMAVAAFGVAAAVAPAAGALWALPAAGAVAAAAFSTVKVATKGMGEAMTAVASGDAKAAEKAMKDMHPAAQSVVRSMAAVSQQFVGVRKSVQGKLFGGLDAEVSALGNNYLPILDVGMGQVATSLNGMAKAGSSAMNTPFMKGVAASVFDTTARALGNFTPAVGPSVTALGSIVKAALPLVDKYSAVAAGALKTKAAFLSSAAGQQYLADKMAAGVAVLGQVWRIIKNIASGITSALTAANASGTSFLGTIEALTAKFAAWAKTAEGQKKLNDLFTALLNLTQSLIVIIPVFAGGLAILAGIFTSLPGPVQTLVASFLTWGSVAGLLISKFAPLIALLMKMKFAWLLTAAVWVAKAIWMTTVTVAKFTWMATVAVAKVMWMCVTVIARWTWMGLMMVARMVGVVLLVVLQFTAMAIAAIAQVTIMTIRVLAQMTLLAVGMMARAVMMAAAWLVAMGPVGWVIAIIIGLVALIIANWDTVKSWTISAWSAVSSAVSSACDAIANWVNSKISAAVGFIVGAWNNAKRVTAAAWDFLVQTVSTGAGRVVTFVRELPGKILSALGNLGSLLLGAGAQLIDGLLTGIKNHMIALLNWVRTIASQIAAAKGPKQYDMRVLTPAGNWLMDGLRKGMNQGATGVLRDAAALAGQVRGVVDMGGRDGLGALAGVPGRGMGATPGADRAEQSAARLAAAVGQAVHEALHGARMEIDGRGVARVVNRRNLRDSVRGGGGVPAMG